MPKATPNFPIGRRMARIDNGVLIIDIPTGCEAVVLIDGSQVFFDMGRAGGDVPCKTCEKKLYDHPGFDRITDNNGNPYLTLGCGARLYKL